VTFGHIAFLTNLTVRYNTFYHLSEGIHWLQVDYSSTPGAVSATCGNCIPKKLRTAPSAYRDQQCDLDSCETDWVATLACLWLLDTDYVREQVYQYHSNKQHKEALQGSLGVPDIGWQFQ
jgi:hypothetical protein